MSPQDHPVTVLQDWCREAVALWGDDWSKINNYIQEKLTHLGEAELLSFSQAVALALTTDEDSLPH
jgi:hypothetical protein